ncbi:MAG: methionine aminotransferase [Steroidobacteraceae bacterium]
MRGLGEAGKLPDVGTTVFTVISRRAAELGALNLGQGFPDYAIDPRLAELVHEAMRRGFNQYAPMIGSAALRSVIAARLKTQHGVDVDPETEITVTQGATEALYSTIQALVGQGDEAIVFDPSYDSYDPAIRLAGGRCVHIPLVAPGFAVDWQRVRTAITPRTRLILINSPHNPSATVLSAADLRELAELVTRHDLLVLSDEVYEHLMFDGARHASVLGVPALRKRSVAVYSFGKMLHATGLRIGYAVAPPALSAELRKVHQFNTFAVTHPLQQAIADYLVEQPDCGARLPVFFQPKRDRVVTALAGSGLGLPRAAGSYFQLLDYSAWADVPDTVMAERLLTEAGVALIPLSPFYKEPATRQRLLRLCFAKRDATLDEAVRRLVQFGN